MKKINFYNLIKKKNREDGFTLVDILVAVAVFSIVISISVNLFVSGIRIYEYQLKNQLLLSQVSYAMEYMSRSLRMAKKDENGSCITSGYNYEITDRNGVRFINSNNDECWEFFLEKNHLKVDRNGKIYDLTGNSLKVNSFNIVLIGDSFQQQPRVTFFLDVQANAPNLSTVPKLKIQTTVSERNLNF